MEIFSDKLKLLRKKLGLSQTEMGKELGLSYQTVSDLERGHTQPSPTLIRYAELRWGENLDQTEAVEEERREDRTMEDGWAINDAARQKYPWLKVLIEAANQGQDALVRGVCQALADMAGAQRPAAKEEGETKKTVNFP